MKVNGIAYLTSQGFKYFWTNKIMSVTSVSVLATCLLIIGSFWLTYLNVQTNLKEISAENAIVVFLKPDVDDAGAAAVGEKIQKLSNVAKCTYISKEEGLASYRKQFPDQADLLADMEQDNPLSDAYHIQLKDITHFDDVLYQLDKIDQIERVKSRPDIAEKLTMIGQVITFISSFVMLLLLAVSLFILVNTIKLARFVHRKEINIMKFVGATNGFIRIPFVIDGALMGIISGLIAFFAQKYLYIYLGEALGSLSNIISMLSFGEVQWTVLGAYVGAGFLVGVLGSAITIKKYLDV